MEQNVKLFAFKLAQQETQQEVAPAVVRDGVASAGCSGDDLRLDSWYWGRDQGEWC